MSKRTEALSKKLEKSQQDAKRRHDILMGENLMMLEEISNELKARQAAAKNERINWGHVGDASHYHEQLKEIRDQLLKLGEFAE